MPESVKLYGEPMLKRILTFLACLLLPQSFMVPVLRLLGHRVARNSRIGFSAVFVKEIYLNEQVRVGNLNILVADKLILRERARIGSWNFIRGPLRVALGEAAEIGNRNVITRASRGVTVGPATLWLGPGAKITAAHKLDCTKSIKLGRHSTLAGCHSQVWTHGYINSDRDPGRYRIDGKVSIGNYVNVGSRAIILGGVEIAGNVIIGSGATVSNDINASGMYVSSPLTFLPFPSHPDNRAGLVKSHSKNLVEPVYRKLGKYH